MKLKPVALDKLKIKVPQSVDDWRHKADHFFHMTYTGLESVYGHGPTSYVAIAMFLIAFLGIFIAHVDH